jgi:hypothetical protein
MQVHVYELMPIEHKPPFLQGLDKQKLIGFSQYVPVHPAAHKHLLFPNIKFFKQRI